MSELLLHRGGSTPINSPWVPNGQPYFGPLYSEGVNEPYAQEFWVRDQGLVGQINPNEAKRLAMQEGRYLSGLGEGPDGIGAVDFGGSIGDDPNFPTAELEHLEELDDNYGSGIFSGSGNQLGRATANAEMGVFSSNYSLPGYIGREIPYAVSKEVTDITDDADVVVVPGGGFQYIESNSHVTPPPVLGPTPRPPHKLGTHRAPSGPYDTYVQIDDGADQGPLNPYAPDRTMPRYGRPARDPQNYVKAVAPAPTQRIMPRALQPSMPASSIVTPLSGDEPSKSPPSVGEMFLWGALVGVGVGTGVLAYQAWRDKRKPRRAY